MLKDRLDDILKRKTRPSESKERLLTKLISSPKNTIELFAKKNIKFNERLRKNIERTNVLLQSYPLILDARLYTPEIEKEKKYLKLRFKERPKSRVKIMLNIIHKWKNEVDNISGRILLNEYLYGEKFEFSSLWQHILFDKYEQPFYRKDLEDLVTSINRIYPGPPKLEREKVLKLIMALAQLGRNEFLEPMLIGIKSRSWLIRRMFFEYLYYCNISTNDLTSIIKDNTSGDVFKPSEFKDEDKYFVCVGIINEGYKTFLERYAKKHPTQFKDEQLLLILIDKIKLGVDWCRDILYQLIPDSRIFNSMKNIVVDENIDDNSRIVALSIVFRHHKYSQYQQDLTKYLKDLSKKSEKSLVIKYYALLCLGKIRYVDNSYYLLEKIAKQRKLGADELVKLIYLRALYESQKDKTILSVLKKYYKSESTNVKKLIKLIIKYPDPSKIKSSIHSKLRNIIPMFNHEELFN